MTDRARTCGECRWYWACEMERRGGRKLECAPRRAFRVLRDEVRRLRNERIDMVGRRDRSGKKRA